MASPRKLLAESKNALKEIMAEHLAEIADELVSQVMRRVRLLPESQKLDAIKDLWIPGVDSYRETLKTGLSVVALEALAAVKAEVPKASHIKLSESEDDMQLSEFDRLPPGMKKKIEAKSGLLADTQIADLEKGIVFQFTSSLESTESLDVLEADLHEAAFDLIDGSSIDAGAGVSAAEMVNQTRKEWFEQDDVMEELDAFEFINGDPVSPICRSLPGLCSRRTILTRIGTILLCTSTVSPSWLRS